MSAPAITFSPAPSAAGLLRVIASQAWFELRLTMRNGEQVLLTMLIPIGLLFALKAMTWADFGGGGNRIDVGTPGIIALAIISTAFTSQAIATGFDRRYGVLKLLGAAPLPRWGLVAAKTLTISAIEAIQIALICGIALAFGWQARGSFIATAVFVLVGTAAFSSLGLALAGILRAEATLAVANAIYLVFLLAGGTVIPTSRLPEAMARVVELTPSGALGDGLRAVLLNGDFKSINLVALLIWASIGTFIASRTFKWE